MMGCTTQNRCGFYRQFSCRKSRTWVDLVETYCNGTLFPYCSNWLQCQRTGEMPGDRMMPSGELVPKTFLQLK